MLAREFKFPRKNVLTKITKCMHSLFEANIGLKQEGNCSVETTTERCPLLNTTRFLPTSVDGGSFQHEHVVCRSE